MSPVRLRRPEDPSRLTLVEEGFRFAYSASFINNSCCGALAVSEDALRAPGEGTFGFPALMMTLPPLLVQEPYIGAPQIKEAMRHCAHQAESSTVGEFATFCFRLPREELPAIW